jgi:hypothetical protein
MTGREELDLQVMCQQVLAGLGNPAGSYVESACKEFVTTDRGFHIDYWHLVVVVPGAPVMHVQHPAKNIPCEACGEYYPATMLQYGACITCWSTMPYALPLQG